MILSSWVFILFALGFVALIAGTLLGFMVGWRTGRRQERFRQVKEKLKRNKTIIWRWQKERFSYAEKIQQLENELSSSVQESEQYRVQVADLVYYRQKLSESERMIELLSVDQLNSIDSNLFTILMQLKADPVHTNLTREEWNELFHLTDLLFNRILTDWKEKYAITRHEQEICCLVKWNFSRKEQLAVFNNTSEALTKSKNRLKKKLNLDETIELDAFIRLA